MWKNLWDDILLIWRTDRVERASTLLDMQLAAFESGMNPDLNALVWRRNRLVSVRTRLSEQLERRELKELKELKETHELGRSLRKRQ
jgi:hypothetical protein